MSDPTDAALDSWINWLEDLPLPKDFDEGVTGLQGFITALRTERAKDHAEINLKADFIEATLNQLAASEETIESLRSERDAAFARESAAYARGVQAAANLLDSMRRDPQYAGEGCDPIIAAIRALADAPPVPVVGVKPDAAIILAKEMQMIVAADRWKGRPLTSTPPEKWQHLRPETQQFWTDTAARILAALLPRMEGGDA